MIHIEFFNNVKDRTKHSIQPLERILTKAQTSEILRLKTNHYREWLNDNPDATSQQKSNMKANIFNAVIFSGTFTGTGKAEDIRQMSGLLVLDIDNVENLFEVGSKLKKDKYTYLMFLSPSGNGIKVVIKHNLKERTLWKYLFNELEAYYLDKYNIVLDKSGKDINRMCFLPYIEKKDFYYNNNCEEWQYTGIFKRQTKTPKNMLLEISDIYALCHYIALYLKENNINITEQYEDWISYGYSLCDIGEQGRAIFHNISSVSDKYDYDICDKKFDYLLQHYDKEKSGIENFVSNGKKAIATHCLFQKYGFISPEITLY